MDAKELASLLDGRQYRNEITREESNQAKAAGLVVVHGGSDDLMEFAGAIYDEIGCYNGGDAYVDSKGLLPDRDSIDESDEELKSYFARQPNAVLIRALWGKEGYSWIYETSIPHEVFHIFDGADPYCRGIVFSLADVKGGA